MSRHASNNAIRGVLILAGSERVLLGERSALLPDSEAIEGMVLERFAAVGQDRM